MRTLRIEIRYKARMVLQLWRLDASLIYRARLAAEWRTRYDMPYLAPPVGTEHIMVRPDGHRVYMAQTVADLPPVVGGAVERTVVVAANATDQERSDREVAQALHRGLADMQVTLARLREVQDVDCVTNIQQTLAIQTV